MIKNIVQDVTLFEELPLSAFDIDSISPKMLEVMRSFLDKNGKIYYLKKYPNNLSSDGSYWGIYILFYYSDDIEEKTMWFLANLRFHNAGDKIRAGDIFNVSHVDHIDSIDFKDFLTKLKNEHKKNVLSDLDMF